MSTAFNRLVWKEVRSQRSFWLALLAGYVAISLLCLVLYGSDLYETVVSIAVMAGSAFAIGSAALSFSNEEQDRTALLMRMLPVPTRTLAGAKITATVLGTITLVFVCLVFSVVASVVAVAVSAIASMYWPQSASHWSGMRVLTEPSIQIMPVYAIVLGLVSAWPSECSV